MKLSRKQIRETLEAVPIDRVLLGAPAAGRELTPKQRAFAEGIAMGKSKAGAYRDAYASKGKPATQSRKGQELAKSDAIRAQIEALKLAAEARKYQTPAELRSLVIERLTAHAISDEVAPAQRLRALELLGKVTEVAAFTERREVVHQHSSDELRSRLMATLRGALQAQAIDVDVLELERELQPPALPGDQPLDLEPQALEPQPDADAIDSGPDARDETSRADSHPPATPARAQGAPLPN